MVSAIPLTDEAVAAFAAALVGDGGAVWREMLDEELAAWAGRLAGHHFIADRDAETAKDATVALINQLRAIIGSAGE